MKGGVREGRRGNEVAEDDAGSHRSRMYQGANQGCELGRGHVKTRPRTALCGGEGGVHPGFVPGKPEPLRGGAQRGGRVPLRLKVLKGPLHGAGHLNAPCPPASPVLLPSASSSAQVSSLLLNGSGLQVRATRVGGNSPPTGMSTPGHAGLWLNAGPDRYLCVVRNDCAEEGNTGRENIY